MAPFATEWQPTRAPDDATRNVRRRNRKSAPPGARLVREPITFDSRRRYGRRVGRSSNHRSAKTSSLLLVFDVAAENSGDIGVFLFGFLDKSGVVKAFVVDLDILVGSDRFHHGLLFALALGIGLFERDEFGLRGFRQFGLDFPVGGSGGSGRGRVTGTITRTEPTENPLE